MEYVTRLSPGATEALKRQIDGAASGANESHHAMQPVAVTIAKPPIPPTDPVYLPPKHSWDIRLCSWCISQLFTPQRLARFLRWFPWTYLQVRGFFKSWSWGRQVRQDEYIKRMAACEKCPARQVRIVPTRGGWVGKNYCGKCGCPEWALSQLEKKNKMVGWKCPLRRHEGTYGDETYRHLIPKSGCSSCGGAS